MATVTVPLTSDVNSALNEQRINEAIESLTGTSALAQASRVSTADANVGKVTIKSVDTIKVTDSTGAVISNERAVFTFPYAPNDLRFDGMTDNYTELERAGLKPLVRRNTKSIVKVAFGAKIVNPEGVGYLSCEPLVNLLSSIASLNVDLYLVGLGPIVSGRRFRITDMSTETKRMNPQQQITIADVNLTFSEVIEVGKVVPGMSLLKDPPLSTTIPVKYNSGSKGGPSGDEIDWWTVNKNAMANN